MPSGPGGGRARRAARHALDRRFPELRALAQQAVTPHGGWVRAIREAVGMSATDLGARMGTHETSVFSLERHERTGRVRLDTLARAADALDCDLVYALVPRRPLERMVEERAQLLAAQLLGRVGHSMTLEGQQVGSAAVQEQLREQAARLRDQPGLWRDA